MASVAELHKEIMKMSRKLASMALTGVALLAMSAQVQAGKGGNSNKNGPSGSDTTFVLNESAPIVFGQSVTFTVSAPQIDRPFSQVDCYQNGARVYSSSRGHFEDYYVYFGDPIHYLSSLAWPGGDADCTASLVELLTNGRIRTHSSFGFHVSAG